MYTVPVTRQKITDESLKQRDPADAALTAHIKQLGWTIWPMAWKPNGNPKYGTM